MYEIVKEFIGAVAAEVGKEIIRAGSGAAIAFVCLLAFLCIAVGIFMESRCALLYYVTPEGKRRFLGSIFVQKAEKNYKIVIPEGYMEQSESIHYSLQLPTDFAHRHYMEEMQIEMPCGKSCAAIKKQVHFQCRLRDKLPKRTKIGRGF